MGQEKLFLNSVISEGGGVGNIRLCETEPHLWLKRVQPKAGIEGKTARSVRHFSAHWAAEIFQSHLIDSAGLRGAIGRAPDS